MAVLERGAVITDDRRRNFTAACLSLLLHGAVVVGLLRPPHPPVAADPGGEAVVEVTLVSGSDAEEGRGEASPSAPSLEGAPADETVAPPPSSDRAAEADTAPKSDDPEGPEGAFDDVEPGAKQTPVATSAPEEGRSPPETATPSRTESASPKSPEIEAPSAEPTVEPPTRKSAEASSRGRAGREAAKVRSPRRRPKPSPASASVERPVTARGAVAAAADRPRPGSVVGKQSGGSASDLAAYLARVRARIASRQGSYGGERGRVGIRFDVVGNGDLVGLTAAFGDRGPLADAALRVVRRGSPAPPIPPSLGRDRIPVTVTIVFE